jgi:hypothetical protein
MAYGQQSAPRISTGGVIARDNEINALVLSYSFGDEMNLMFKNDMENSKQIELDHGNIADCASAWMKPPRA